MFDKIPLSQNCIKYRRDHLIGGWIRVEREQKIEDQKIKRNSWRAGEWKNLEMIQLSLLLGLIGFLPVFCAASYPTNMTEAEAIDLISKLSNWGRWGAHDELGMMNLHTAESRRAGILILMCFGFG